MTSRKFQLRREDVEKWVSNSFVFLAPLGVIYFGFLAANLTDGLQWEDFVPNAMTAGAMVLYLANVLLDLSRKWANKTNYR